MLDSINNISPPAAVHAIPVTTPGLVVLSAKSDWNFGIPRYSFTVFLDILAVLSFLLTTSTAIFRRTLEISRSKLLTPDSLVYEEIISLIPVSLNFTCFVVSPFSLICLGIKCFLAICTFSSSIYPLKSIISILSYKAGGILSG